MVIMFKILLEVIGIFLIIGIFICVILIQFYFERKILTEYPLIDDNDL